MCSSQNCKQNSEFTSTHTTHTGHFSASNCWSVPLQKGLLHPSVSLPMGFMVKHRYLCISVLQARGKSNVSNRHQLSSSNQKLQANIDCSLIQHLVHSLREKTAMHFRFSRRFISKSQSYEETIRFSFTPKKYLTGNLFCDSSFIRTFLKYRKGRETPGELTGITRIVAFVLHQDSHERSLKIRYQRRKNGKHSSPGRLKHESMVHHIILVQDVLASLIPV